MKKSNDLKIEIALTPSQLSFLPAIINKMNSEPEMLMDRLVIQGTTLLVSCHDVVDLAEEMKTKLASEIEFSRLMKQIKKALSETLHSQELTAHQKKNFLISSQSFALGLGTH